MSKSIRIADYLYEEVERLASEEKRSLANMVAVLLEQALRGAELTEQKTSSSAENLDPHFKPDPKR